MCIGAKQISQIKYYKNIPKVAEDIAYCYLILFNESIPKTHYWEKFIIFLAQPGTVIQKLRQLPVSLENNYFDPLIFAKINDIYSKIPKSDLKVESFYYELKLLIAIIKEILNIVEIPIEESKIVSPVRIPELKKPDISHLEYIMSMPAQDILQSNDSNLLKQAIAEEKKILIRLKGEFQREQYDEIRNLKYENLKEIKRDEVREIEIQKNTVRFYLGSTI